MVGAAGIAPACSKKGGLQPPGPTTLPNTPVLLLVRRPGLEPGLAGLKVRCSHAIKLATQKLAGKVGLEPTCDTLTVCSPTAGALSNWSG